MTELNLVWIALAAFLGGIIAATLGYWDSNGPFNAKKFGRSILFALLAAGVFAVGYKWTAESLGIRDIIFGILGGAGVDVLSNRALGATRS